MLWGQGRKIIRNPRVSIGLDNMLRNYRNLKTNPSLRMQNFPQISWALFGEAIVRIGYEQLRTYEQEKGLAAAVNLIVSSGLNPRWANLLRTRFRHVPLNIYLHVTFRTILQRYHQYIRDAMEKSEIKPVSWTYFLQAVLDIGLWQVENMPTKDATHLIPMTVAQFETEALAEIKTKLEAAFNS